MTGPLDGIKVLEFSQIVAGPFGGMLLSDMGAEVIKIEPLQGEPWRQRMQFIPGESKTYMALNRGKKSLPLNLNNPDALKILYQFIPKVDVIVINARPDVPAKLGIDYTTLAGHNPKLIYCETTAFGTMGPQSNRPGYDLIVQAMSGLMAAEGKIKQGVPQHISATPLADYATGIAVAWGVCAALYSREKTGRGQRVDATLLATALSMQSWDFMEIDAYEADHNKALLQVLGQSRKRGDSYETIDARYKSSRLLRGSPYYRTYQAKNGVLAIACLSNHLRKRVANILDIDDPRFQAHYNPFDERSVAEADEKIAQLAENIFLQRTVEEWLEIFDRLGVPAGPVKFIEELLEDEQVKANGLVVELEHSLVGKVKMTGPILKMSETPLEAHLASPALGEHTDELLKELGYTHTQIQTLRNDHVIG